VNGLLSGGRVASDDRCDHRGPVVLIIQHEHDAGPGQLAAALQTAGLQPEVWQAAAGRPVPDQVGSYVGLVVLGGRMSANETKSFPYLVAVKELIRDAAARGVPVLGICLGAQLAAAALGGRVTRRPDGPRIGWRVARKAGGDSPIPLGRGARLFYWHGDRYEVPDAAVALLEGWDAFRVGSVFGFQSHPEVTGEIIDAWCRTEGGIAELASTGISARQIVEEAPGNEHYGREILAAWCGEVRSSIARSVSR
jgi:GMP synthase (glutamine-hydrolysing)